MSFYDYILFKPESQRKFKSIVSAIQDNDFNIYKYYFVRDWKKLSLELYNEQFKNNNDFKISFESLCYIINNFFGNNGIVAILKNNDADNIEFAKQIVELKYKIRDKLLNNNSIVIAADINKLPISKENAINNGRLALINNENKAKSLRRFPDIGLYKFHTLTYIHCPDADEKTIYKELSIAESLGIFNKENQLRQEQINEVFKFKNFDIISEEYKEIEK